MLEYLETLRAKPRHTRKQIAFLTASVFSVLIFSTWFFSRTSPISDGSISLSQATAPIAVVANTFMGFKENTANTFDQEINDIKAQMEEMDGLIAPNERTLLASDTPEMILGSPDENIPPETTFDTTFAPDSSLVSSTSDITL